MATLESIRSVEVVLTAGCNLRCGYCYQNDKKARSMGWETLRASADLVLASAGRDINLLFIGGEPLLEFPLIRQAVEYIETRRPRHLRVHYEIVTNGTLLRDEHMAFLVQHDFGVQLSFDGVPAAQVVRGAGTFEILDRLLVRLREDHPAFLADQLTVATTLIPSTICHLADSVDYFLGKGVRALTVSPAMTHQPEWRPDRIAELDHQFARVFDACLRHYERTGLVPLTAFARERGAVPSPQPGPTCAAGRGDKASVDVDGQVHGCVTFVDSYQTFPTSFLRTRLDAMRMGGVADPDLARRVAEYPEAVRATGIFHDKHLKYSSYGRCAECRFLAECSICPTSIGHQPGHADPHRIPDFQCAFSLVALKYRERFPAQAPARERLLTGMMPARLHALLRVPTGSASKASLP